MVTIIQATAKILVGVQSVFLCCDEEAVENGARFCPLYGVGKQPIFAPNSKGSDLILNKIGDIAFEEMGRYFSAEKKKLVGAFENFWNKYQISLERINIDRDQSMKKLNKFLSNLEYIK